MADEHARAFVRARTERGLHHPTGEELAPTPSLERFLADAIARARASWPGVDLPAPAFLEHLATQLGSGGREELERLRTSDLYLAAACASGLPGALQAFESTFFEEARAVVRRVAGSLEVDELVQSLRESLFVGHEGRQPKIVEYSGRGDLRSWLRVVVTRATLNAATRGPKERPTDDAGDLLDASGQVDSAEIAYFRAHYEEEVKRLFPEALAVLTVRQRLFLRQRFLDHLTIEQMSRMHDVHAATVKRQIADARAALAATLRRLLCERLTLSPSELESVLRVVQSRFHISMRRLLPPGGSSTSST